MTSRFNKLVIKASRQNNEIKRLHSENSELRAEVKRWHYIFTLIGPMLTPEALYAISQIGHANPSKNLDDSPSKE